MFTYEMRILAAGKAVDKSTPENVDTINSEQLKCNTVIVQPMHVFIHR